MHDTNLDLGRFARYREIIDDWDAFVESLHRPLPLSVWCNRLRCSPEELQEFSARHELALEPVGWHPWVFRIPPQTRVGRRVEFLLGLYHVQEEVSVLPALLAAPQPTHRCLDLCAAPGNKTALLAVLMENRGSVLANDLSMPRMRAVRGHLDRLGLLNVSLTTLDGKSYPLQSGPFDRLLVDAPCSCEGTSRKTPSVLAREPDHGYLAMTQRELLTRAVELAAPGARILYSTCTYAPEENEMVVQQVLDYYGEDTLTLREASWPGIRHAPGLTQWGEHSFSPQMRKTMRLWPHLNDTGGFFIALLQKQGSPPARHEDTPPASIQKPQRQKR